MAKTPEARVKDEIKALLQEYGAYYTMPVKLGYGNNGELDFNVGLHGYRLDIEAKAGKNHPSELQWRHIERLAMAGCSSLVINEHNQPLLRRWLELVAKRVPMEQVRVRPYRKAKGRGVERHARF